MLYIFAVQNNQIMKMQRELLLQISEIETTTDAFKVAYKMMIALRDEQITSEQYDLLSGELQMTCKSYKIGTQNELVSLF